MRMKDRSIFKPRASGTYKINAAKKDETVIYLYDEISWWGIQADQFVKDLNAIETPTIRLRMNSPGGSVFDGTAIYNALKQHESRIIVHIDGLAASIASIIAMAGDEVRAAENAFFMVHDPWSIVIGTAEMMREEADLLDKVSVTMAKTYQAKTGKSEEEILQYMAKETWFTGQEALDAGFVDFVEKLDENEQAKAKVSLFDLSAFAHVPDHLKAEKTLPTERETEKILRDAGFSRKQSEEILAKGYAEALRDAGADGDLSADGDNQGDPGLSAQGDPEPPPKKRIDPVVELLVRGERLAPTLTTN